MATKKKVEVFGLKGHVNYMRARCCAEDIFQKNPDHLEKPVIVQMWRFEYDCFIEEKKRELRGDMWHFRDGALIFVDGEVKGGTNDFIAWARKHYNFEEFRPMALYHALIEEDDAKFLAMRKRRYVYLDVSVGRTDIGRLVIELFTDIVPKTCANFEDLCTGLRGVDPKTGRFLSYVNCIFHRVVPNGWIQGGAIESWRPKEEEEEEEEEEAEEDGSTRGRYMADENFAVLHDKRGVVGMANFGRNTNQAQFYITLQPTPWMNGRYVAFGQLVEGGKTLWAMEQMETANERPVINMVIKACGKL